MQPKTNFEYGFKPGDIFAQSYGFDGSDHTVFFKVTKVTARFLTIVRVAGRIVPCGIVPDPNKEIERPIRKKVYDWGVPGRERPCIDLPVANAYPWSGEVCPCDAC